MSLFNRNDKSGEATVPQQPQAAQLQTAQLQAAQSKSQSAAPNLAEPPRPVAIAKPTPTPAKIGASMASVISKALKITGELESTEDIQIDGQIDGDVRGVGVKIGQHAKVRGTVYGEEVELAGTIEGKIESKKVILTGTARMTGDIWHQDIRIESGAYISGNLKPESDKSEAKPAPKPVLAPSASVSPVSTGNATGAAAHR
jgi:cytoskeletal protein CcmA (bactofilin family)